MVHPFVTLHCFGWRVFLRALAAGPQQTFLEIVTQTAAARPVAEKVPDMVSRCVRLERSAARLYQSLANRYAQQKPVQRFFETLVQQEKCHAELLELCRTSANRGNWLEEQFAPWRAAIPELEARMNVAIDAAATLPTLTDALRLVIEIESSELNEVFDGIVRATDSEFVRAVSAFWTAERTHLTYICQTIPRLQPELAAACERIREKFQLADIP